MFPTEEEFDKGSWHDAHKTRKEGAIAPAFWRAIRGKRELNLFCEWEVIMFNIGPWELGLILLVALIVVGPGKLPEVAKSIGKGINEFKKVTNGYKREFQEAMDSFDTPVQPENKPMPVAEATTIAEMADQFDTVVKAQEPPGPSSEDASQPRTER